MNKDPYHEEADRIDLAFFLLRRNGRIILGLVLVAAISLWIYNASTSTRDPTSAGTWSKKLGQFMPAANIDNEPTLTEEKNEVAEEIKSESKDRVLNINEFLATATTEEKVDASLNIRENYMKKELPVGYVLMWRRAKISRHLIESEVDDKTRIFAYNEYIESIMTLDAMNCQGQLGVPGIREALREVGTMFEDFPDDVIKSKASLAPVLEPAHDYLATKDLSHINRMWPPFEAQSEKLFLEPATSIRLVKLIVELYSKSNYASEFKEPCLRIAEKLKSSENEKIANAGRLLKEQIYFAQPQLYSLAERIEGGNLQARTDVQLFFEGLAVNPSSRLEIYQIAIDVVAQYKKLGLSKDASDLANWLNDINSKNAVPENQSKIANAVTELLR